MDCDRASKGFDCICFHMSSPLMVKLVDLVLSLVHDVHDQTRQTQSLLLLCQTNIDSFQ